MKVNEFIELLEQNRSKELKFEYLEGKYVDASYHLTEVKNVTFETTDCGGKTNSWTETQMQLWEKPEEKGKSEFMSTDKILSILERVNKIRPLWQETELKFEYGNSEFNTGVMPALGTRSSDDYLVIVLFEEKARCKANDLCGYQEKETSVEQPCC